MPSTSSIRGDPAGIIDCPVDGNRAQALGVCRGELVHQPVVDVAIERWGHGPGSLIRTGCIEWVPEEDKEGIAEAVENALAPLHFPDRTLPGKGIELCRKIAGLHAFETGKLLQRCRHEGKTREQPRLFR